MHVDKAKIETKALGLTQSQTAIWTGQMLHPASPLYNMIYTFEFAGEIDPALFQTAFRGLIERSDSLRTIFPVGPNSPRQRVVSRIDYQLEYLDWSGESSPRERLHSWLDARGSAILKLEECSFDSVLIKTGEERFVWYFNQHHLTTDARSVALYYRKMSELYEGSRRGEIGAVEKFPPFRKYLDFEKNAQNDPGRSVINSYWKDKIRSLPSPPRLYGHAGFAGTTRSERIVVDLGKSRSNALTALTNDPVLRSLTKDLSLFNIFATVLFAFLYRVSGQENLAIGTPVHNRSTPDFKQTPGLFIEFFPFQAELKNEDTFESLFRRINIESLGLLRHALPGAGTPDGNRSFNVVLNYVNTVFTDFNWVPCNATWRHPKHGDAEHHLRLHIYNDRKSETIKLIFDFNRGAFSQPELESVPEHFLSMLDAFTNDPRQEISSPRLISSRELNAPMIEDNNPDGAKDDEILTVVELFQKQVAENPDSSAVIVKDRTLSYSELDQRSDVLASYLIKQGLSEGDRIVLYLKRSADLLIGILGTWKAGCTYVPVAANNPRERIIERIRESDAKVLLTHGEMDELVSRLPVPVIKLEREIGSVEKGEDCSVEQTCSPDADAYIMFTSGTSGNPKGVRISHRALQVYVRAASRKYADSVNPVFPLFTTIDFDLTVTSLFVPLVTGGSIVVYEEPNAGPDLAVLDVINDNRADVVKLTPSHLTLLGNDDLENLKAKTLIVGGEDFRSDLAARITRSVPPGVRIFNEYGPTEATVGCILHEFDANYDRSASVPIGKPFAQSEVYLLDKRLNPVPPGVSGELYISGPGLSDGYSNDPELTSQKFVANPFRPGTKMYQTGDMARLNRQGKLVCLGRIDHQIKIGGIRIEPGEIESVLSSYPGIDDCAVELIDGGMQYPVKEIVYCARCGLPSNYPNAEFDETEICSLCRSFETYRLRARNFFKTPGDLKDLFESAKADREGDYDCLMLLSGGKDSTYALAKLAEMGLSVLAFTLDNGYISDQAKSNIRRVVKDLEVDHIFGTTPAMNAIFVDSLKRHKNVCNGCFKTIYTLSIKVALEKKIPFIVTGLSRGQFFETRLTEELFWNDDVEQIDTTILEARKNYHRINDEVRKSLDTSIFDDDAVFEKVRFIDFYRYFDVSLDEMLAFLDKHLPWVRPTDTGRSTNCLINQVGIYVHKKELGYSNYAFPYSWDVRMGHKTRENSVDEINEAIDETKVKKIIREIGYREQPFEPENNETLIGCYVSNQDIPALELRNHLSQELPSYMIPSRFRRLDALPTTANGKIDRRALRKLDLKRTESGSAYSAPKSEIEILLTGIWSEVLRIESIGARDNFLELGGHSLAAIRIIARTNEALDLDIPLNKIFELPTIRELSQFIEHTIARLLNEFAAGAPD